MLTRVTGVTRIDRREGGEERKGEEGKREEGKGDGGGKESIIRIQAYLHFASYSRRSQPA